MNIEQLILNISTQIGEKASEYTNKETNNLGERMINLAIAGALLETSKVVINSLKEYVDNRSPNFTPYEPY